MRRSVFPAELGAPSITPASVSDCCITNIGGHQWRQRRAFLDAAALVLHDVGAYTKNLLSELGAQRPRFAADIAAQYVK